MHLQVHYPTEALQSVSFSDSKTQLLQAQVWYLCLLLYVASCLFYLRMYHVWHLIFLLALIHVRWCLYAITNKALITQKSELRCLLPKSLLDRGFFPNSSSESKNVQECAKDKGPNYSWSGQRKTPSYVNKLVFPEDFLTSLRTVSMQEKELFNVQSLLEEVWWCNYFSCAFYFVSLFH